MRQKPQKHFTFLMVAIESLQLYSKSSFLLWSTSFVTHNTVYNVD